MLDKNAKGHVLDESAIYMKREETIKAVFTLVISLVVLTSACATSYIHLEGTWTYRERHSVTNLQLVCDGIPFEAYVGITNYYLVVDGKKENSFSVGTSDGMDYFWVNYFFQRQKEAMIPVSRDKWRGIAEVGRGRFPTSAVPLLQGLWFVFFWAAHTNDFPASTKVECVFETQRFYRTDIAYDNGFTIAAKLKTDNKSLRLQSIKFYAPGRDILNNNIQKRTYTLSSPYDKGWLYSGLDVLEETNFASQDVPVHFALCDYSRKEHESTNSTSDPDNVVMMEQYDFFVKKLSSTSRMPSLYPPIFKGKMVAVNDYRNDSDGKMMYLVGDVDDNNPRNAIFVSRGTPGYNLLVNGRMQELRFSRVKPNSKLIRYCIVGFVTLSPILVYFICKKQHKRSGITTEN